MSNGQINAVYILLLVSVAFFLLSFIVPIIRSFIRKIRGNIGKNSGVGQMLVFSILLFVSLWCARYAVGFYNALTVTEENVATSVESIFSSVLYSLKAFGVEENYLEFVTNGKNMLTVIAPDQAALPTYFGVYVSVLHFLAPIAGGAIIFEMIASIFPKIRLGLSIIAFWKEKFYFSELNSVSIALANSICKTKTVFTRPVMVFTDAYSDRGDEKSSELILKAKSIGAICVRDDIAHVIKNRFGKHTYVLIDEVRERNLQALTELANDRNYVYLKNAEVLLFTDNSAYIEVEKSVNEILSEKKGFIGAEKRNLPTIIPVQGYRNLAAKLFADIPLYEPLVHKRRNSDGTVDLNITIIGAGTTGTEMFLAAYWFGQILDCKLTINVVSRETESEFWNKIDYINPEIKQSTEVGNNLLKINKNGDMAEPYCKVNYIECDVMSSQFIRRIDKPGDGIISNTDYFLVTLGTDEDNISVANTLRNYTAERHIASKEISQTIIAYVVYDSALAETLNRKKMYSYSKSGSDIFMCAVGYLEELYSANTVFMSDYTPLANAADENYMSHKNRKTTVQKHKNRFMDDYKHWATQARARHIKYKAFSMGLFDKSIFDFSDNNDSGYIDMCAETLKRYKETVKGERKLNPDITTQEYINLLHRLAWLEHRRWNAFTRVKGFRSTNNYSSYASEGDRQSYKQMDIKLHPCLVECDQKGIRGKINEKCEIDIDSLFKSDDRDLLDDLSYDLKEKNYNDYDFKQYDYPIDDPLDKLV